MPAALRQRPSRTGTPGDAVTPPAPSSDSKKPKAQSSLDSWIEPPVQKPTPSFEDHGFARHGVLQGMNPLGVGPSAKIKQRTRTLDDLPASLMGPGKNGTLGFGEEGVSTPEMTPARELEQEDSERQEEEEVMPVYQAEEEQDDDDYVPKKSKAKTPSAKTPVRGKTPVQNKTPITSKTPVTNGVSRPSTAVDESTADAATVPIANFDIDRAGAEQRITIAVNEAVSRARRDGKPEIEYAIRMMHDNSKGEVSVFGVLDSLLRQHQSQQQVADFRRHIKDGKKKFKRENRKRKREEQEEDEAENNSNHLEGANSNGSLLTEDAIAAASEPQNQPHPLSTAPVIAPDDTPSPPAKKSKTKSPRKQTMTNGDTPPALSSDADAGASTKAATPTANPPDTVMNSDSDLSDVNEEIVQNGSPDPVPQPVPQPAAVAAKLKGLAAARKAKQTRNARKSRANSAKPMAKVPKQRQTREETEEIAEYRVKRQKLAEQQPAGIEIPLSDIRFEDEMLETESLTESQIAVGPPIDLSRSRRPGRGQRGLNLKVGKRLREDDDSRLPSPQPGSAATTRPSTPAFSVAPTNKRIKLSNGQAARTKRSPVKNRDGPIAGIAHTGGGGSRHLGPDDNDPGSPPDSDDFCAACKGAGEFVCCDGCPRVFHYLCCDPPRVEPPDGSFLCYECSPKTKQSDDPPVDSFTLFGPLLKRLETTNARAFALPKEIQNFYEGVTAKDDGSYYEEVKKFPLAKSSGYGYQKPDYLKQFDSEQNVILCVQCGRSSAGKRQMLKCDTCHAYWHLDCCDPPLANPPHISLEATTRDAWKCPRHIDHDLRSGYLYQNDLNAVDGDDDVVMAGVHDAPRRRYKVRKPKKPSAIEPTFTRGTRNNGLIDVINSADDDTDGEGNYVFEDLNSKTYRLPEKGIILDFISKVKGQRIAREKEARKEARRAAKIAARRKASQEQFAARPIKQQQAALHLTQLANKQTDIGLNEANVDALVLGLTAEAPDEVVTAISNAGPGPMTGEKRVELLKLRALIDKALQE